MRFDDQLPDDQVNFSREHPLRDAALLALGVIGLCVVIVFVIAGAINLAVPLIPPSLEARVFSLIDLDEDLSGGEEPDDQALYVQALVDDLAAHWDDLPYPLRVLIVDDEVPNAFAVPGGYILVTEGLLDSVESETELAFVLGHEIGHFQQRDHLRGLGRGLAVSLVTYGFDFGGARGALSLVQGAMGIADRHFDRDQESGADLVGLDLVWRQYGHVAGATDFFAEPDEASKPDDPSADWKGPDRRLEGYFSTHPLDRDRALTLDRLADERGWSRSQAPPPLDLPPRTEPASQD